jgi:hypothetical protein
MQKLVVVISFFSLLFCACTPEPLPKHDGATGRIKKDSIPADNAQEISSVDELLPQLPLLRFPLLLAVDSFTNKKTIPIRLNKELNWFSDVEGFPEQPKIAAVGKFYLNLKVIAVVYLVTSPGETDRPDDQQLILSIVNTETGEMNSRTVAVANAEDYGHTFMKTPEEGKSFIHFESENSTITFRKFGIANGKFIPEKGQVKTFPGDQKGSDAAKLAIKNWMK